mmetsp:Transcript_1858/g.2817  ORF Transcript_1858/g.2817 Transcript_1858/m.2817 type:complete len:235 (+) Transcript_1858:92-796(+)
MRLSKEQKELLATLSTNYKTGTKNTNDSHHVELNIINPPLNCPKWACIILPCIKHVPSMKLFKKIIPREAEVRLGNRWVCYDASSLNKGDIVRLNEGDIVPADVQLLNLGLEFVYDGDELKYQQENEHEQESNQETPLELIIDTSQIDGAAKPQTISLNADGTVDAEELYAGSVVLHGEAIAVVTKVGREVLLSRLIKEGQWPPQQKKGWQAVPKEDDNDDQDGISLQRQQDIV